MFSEPVRLGKTGTSGIANGDHDNDGDLDLFIHGVDTTKALYENNSAKNGNHWISIKCIGSKSGSSALGTIVMIKAMIGKKPVWQMREINAQNSFLSQNDLRVHVGLGDAQHIDTIVIKYGSGVSQTFNNVKANTFYQHEEDSKKLIVVKKPS